MGGRRVPPLVLSAADRAALERVVSDPQASHSAGLRATAMLVAAEPGMTTNEVAARLGTTSVAIRKWRKTLVDGGVAGLTGLQEQYNAKAIRYHPWAGDPRRRIAVILRTQADVLRRSCLSLQKRMAENLSTSSQHLQRARLAAEHADQTGAAIVKAARHAPNSGRVAWGAAAARRATGYMPAVKQAAVVGAAINRIVRPVGGQAGSVAPVEFAILTTLTRAGPMRVRDLAEAEQVGPKVIAVRVSALEKRGYLTRTREDWGPGQPRILLTATERTHALVSGASPAGIERFVAGYAQLPPQQRAGLTAALTKLSGGAPTAGAETVAAYAAIGKIQHMMYRSDFSQLTAQAADTLVDVAQYGPLRHSQLVDPDLGVSSGVRKIVEELVRLKFVERGADPTSRFTGMLTATTSGRELASALITKPDMVTSVPFTAAFARLSPDERATLSQGLPRLVELIGG